MSLTCKFSLSIMLKDTAKSVTLPGSPTHTGSKSQESFPRTSERLYSQSQAVNRVVLTLTPGLARRFLMWLPDPASFPPARPSPRTPEPRSSLQRVRGSSRELLPLPPWVTAACAASRCGGCRLPRPPWALTATHWEVSGSSHWQHPACSRDPQTGLQSAGQRPQPGGLQAERSVNTSLK